MCHIGGPAKFENASHVGPPCDFAANRMIFSLQYSERARAADICTYQVCTLTPSSDKVMFCQSLDKIKDFRRKSMNSVLYGALILYFLSSGKINTV